VLDLAAGERAPWEEGHPLTRTPPADGKTWQFTVYGGRFDIGRVRTELVRVFGQDSKPEDARKAGDTALFALTLNAEGKLVADTAVLSSCAWSVSRLRSPGPNHPNWLDGFDKDQRAFAQALNKLVAPELSAAGTQPAGGRFTERVRSAGRDAVAAGAGSHRAPATCRNGLSVRSSPTPWSHAPTTRAPMAVLPALRHLDNIAPVSLLVSTSRMDRDRVYPRHVVNAAQAGVELRGQSLTEDGSRTPVHVRRPRGGFVRVPGADLPHRLPQR
jgi:hypothetical protein